MTKELISILCQQGKDSLERTFAAVPDDKVAWQPAEGARSALDAFGDGAQTLGFMAKMLESKGETPPAFGREFFAQLKAERAGWTRQEALTQFELNWSRFKAALEPLTEEQLAAHVTVPMRGGMTAPLAVWIMMAYRSLISRFAQINYIQTLYGDFDSH
ncbi:hypothetical protein IAD21_02450 [Abditibacteriota bacterium]|nr:hypothetical protein IAD21_02450 [Abditibacteriota bacterium]